MNKTKNALARLDGRSISHESRHLKLNLRLLWNHGLHLAFIKSGLAIPISLQYSGTSATSGVTGQSASDPTFKSRHWQQVTAWTVCIYVRGSTTLTKASLLKLYVTSQYQQYISRGSVFLNTPSEGEKHSTCPEAITRRTAHLPKRSM